MLGVTPLKEEYVVIVSVNGLPFWTTIVDDFTKAEKLKNTITNNPATALGNSLYKIPGSTVDPVSCAVLLATPKEFVTPFV